MIEIIVKSRSGAGKTTIANIIGNHLLSLGFSVSITDDEDVPPDTLKVRSQSLLRAKTAIDISTKQKGWTEFSPK